MNNQPCTRHCRRLGSPKAQAFNPNLRVMATPLFESRRQIDMHRLAGWIIVAACVSIATGRQKSR